MNSATSVVIPCYNGEKYLPEALESVRAQTASVREIIVVDDGSDVPVKAPPGWDGPPLRIVRTPNQGGAAARNAGIALASGAYVAFLDADDIWLPAKIELQERALADAPRAVACYTRCTDEPGFYPFGPYPPLNVRDDEFAQVLWYQAFFPPSTLLVRSDVLREVGGFHDGLGNSGEDNDLYFRILSRGSFLQVPEALCRYRQHPQQFTRKTCLWKRMLAGKNARRVMIERHAEQLVRAGLDRRRLWDAYRGDILMIYYRRDFAAARRLLWDYWRDHPCDLTVLKYAIISLLPAKLVSGLRGRLAPAGFSPGAKADNEVKQGSWDRAMRRIRSTLVARPGNRLTTQAPTGSRVETDGPPEPSGSRAATL